MNVHGFNPARVTDLSRGRGAAASIQKTQSALARVQQQLTTGRRITAPSDAAGDAAVAMQLRKTLESREAYSASLDQGRRYLADADTALSDATDLLREARSIALANLDTGVSSTERQGAASVIRGLERQLLTLANQRSGDMSLFGGAIAGDPYGAHDGAIRFVGTEDVPTGDVAPNTPMHLLMSGPAVFGGASERVGSLDLSPVATTGTRLSTLGGAAGEGIERGSFRITNGTATTEIDLSTADTLGDVINRINSSGAGVTATLVGGNALQLSGTSITVEESGGTTAADLGLLQPAGPSITGDSVRPKVTKFTPLANLNNGAGIDTAGDLTITNGDATDTLDLSSLTTVGDLLDRLNGSKAGLLAGISGDGHSLYLRNPVQGTELRVQEGSGTSAADLGWLTFTANDAVTDFNGGRGLRLNEQGDDLRLTDSTGLRFDVDLSPAGTTQDVVDAINAAAGAAGATTTAVFDPGVPGIVLSDIQRVSDVGDGRASVDLGLNQPITAGTMTGRDVNPVTSQGVFGHLRQLAAALDEDDVSAAERAIGDLETDESNIVRQRAEAGGRLKEIEHRLERIEDENLVTTEMLSRIEETDFSSAVLEFQALQNSLQASLQTTSQLLGISLFDFLR